MFRSVFVAAARSASISFARRPASLIRLLPRQPLQSSRVFAPVIPLQAVRCYASGPAVLTKEEITGRILDLLKNFDKVKDITKLSEASQFGSDLGLDSLDTVEVVMAIEEEFGIEIPDKDADAIQSVEHAITYVVSQPDAH